MYSTWCTRSRRQWVAVNVQHFQVSSSRKTTPNNTNLPTSQAVTSFHTIPVSVWTQRCMPNKWTSGKFSTSRIWRWNGIQKRPSFFISVPKVNWWVLILFSQAKEPLSPERTIWSLRAEGTWTVRERSSGGKPQIRLKGRVNCSDGSERKLP